jgi:hypothetical protein
MKGLRIAFLAIALRQSLTSLWLLPEVARFSS